MKPRIVAATADRHRGENTGTVYCVAVVRQPVDRERLSWR